MHCGPRESGRLRPVSYTHLLQIYLRNVLISMSNTLNDIAKQLLQKDQQVNSTAVQMAAIVVTTAPILCEMCIRDRS